MENGPKILPSDPHCLKDDQFLKNLGFIYNTENYCLRRFPRLVSQLDSDHFARVLSDHVSIIMDRLNLLDDIFNYYQIRPASMKDSSNLFGVNIKGLLVKNDRESHLLLTDLIEVIRYRFTIYELLVNAIDHIAQVHIRTILMQILAEEKKLYQDLNLIKRQFGTINNTMIVKPNSN